MLTEREPNLSAQRALVLAGNTGESVTQLDRDLRADDDATH